MRARLDGFLLDSFLFEFFLKRFGEDSSRSGVPEAKPIRRTPIVRGQLSRKTTECSATGLVNQLTTPTWQCSQYLHAEAVRGDAICLLPVLW